MLHPMLLLLACGAGETGDSPGSDSRPLADSESDSQPTPGDDTAALDADGDGHTSSESGGDDCDDANPEVYPGAVDLCDGADNDCDGAVDEDATRSATFEGWSMPAHAGAGDYMRGWVARDVNGDGKKDILFCYGELAVALNPGGPFIEDEAWTAPWTYTDLGGECCSDMAVFDADGDGDDDVVLAIESSTDLLWSANDAGVFGAFQTLVSGLTRNTQVTAGDFDGDGATDLLAPPFTLWNEGGGIWTRDSMPCPFGESRPGAVALVPDAGDTAVCGATGRTFRATTDRVWSPVPSDSTCVDGYGRDPVAAGDLDADGFIDAIVGGATLCYGDGTGGLGFGTTWVDTDGDGGDTTVTGLADADGDGYDDFVINGSPYTGAPALQLYKGGASGPTLFESVEVPLSAGNTGAAWEDLDGDGQTELLVWNEWEPAFYLYTPNADGTIASPWAGHFSVSDPFRATAADVDGDGQQDLVALRTGDGYSLSVFQGLGGRAFGEAQTVDLDGSSNGTWDFVPHVDLDGDGDEEVLGYLGGSYIILADWDPTGAITFSAYTLPFDTDSGSVFPTATDVDGDGDSELVWPFHYLDSDDVEGIEIGGLAESGFPSTWLDLLAELDDKPILGVGAGADLTGDGLGDVVVLDVRGARVWGWDGAGLVQLVSTDVDWASGSSNRHNRRAIGFADADGDGDADMFIALREQAAVQVLLNDGAGAFGLGDRLAAPAAMVDDSDLAFGSLTAGSAPGVGIAAWNPAPSGTNRGDPALYSIVDGAFVAVPQGWSGIDYTNVITDVDGDGAPDLVGGSQDRAYAYWGTTGVAPESCDPRSP